MRSTTPCFARNGLGALILGLWLAACGLGDGDGTAATGQALAEAPMAGTITLNDSSLPMQTRSSPTGADGSFSVKVAGLLTPYLLRVTWTDAGGSRLRYGLAEANQNVDVNGITDLAFGAACVGQDEEQVFWESDANQKLGTADRVHTHLDTLRAVLAPLFERYGITDPRADRDAVRLLMLDVGVARTDGVVVITNRATGGLIFQGALSALAAGTLHLEHMPAGPGGSTCVAFTYAAYAPCRPDGTQARAVLSSLPAGCTGGSPVTTQACAYVPPVIRCTAFTYAPYGACQPDGTRSREVLSSLPTGCTGGSPATVQACVYVPPVITCTAFTYAPYGACQPDGTRSREILSSLPTGCTGGSPDTMQACSYVPPVVTCTAFTYAPYGACQPDGNRTREVLSSLPAGCTGGSPVTTQACTYVPPVVACTAFTYSAYGACQPDGTQTRTLLDASPSGCTGGSPVTMRACVYTPPLDGAALYTQYCAGCHGNRKKGSSVRSIERAIDRDTGGMGVLVTLTAAQLAAISAAP